MRIDEYISSLRDKDIIVSVQNESIAVNASKEVLTSEVVADLKSRKEEILNFFKSVQKAKKFVSIPKAKEQLYYPLSSAQRRMYFLYELDKEGVSYNIPSFYRVSKDLDLARFDKTIKEIVQIHKSLRSVFNVIDGSPSQRILDSSVFEIIYAQGEPKDIDDFISDFVRPFDLSSELPYRVCLVDIKEEDYLLMIDSHHIINDGVSNDILMRDFWSLYQGDILSPMKIDYIDYAVWQQEEECQDLIASHRDYWLSQYADPISSLDLPMDYSRPKHISNEANTYSLEINKELTAKLRELASSKGVTMYTLFLGFYKILLKKLSNSEDIVVGTPTAGRHHSDLEDVVGMFVNTLALRNEVKSNTTFSSFLENLQSNTLAAFDHQLYPYEDLVDALGVSRDTGRNPVSYTHLTLPTTSRV